MVPKNKIVSFSVTKLISQAVLGTVFYVINLFLSYLNITFVL